MALPPTLAKGPTFTNVHVAYTPCCPLYPARAWAEPVRCGGWGLICTPAPQSTFHCARLAVGAALQLVDAVLTGAVHNGLALVR